MELIQLMAGNPTSYPPLPVTSRINLALPHSIRNLIFIYWMDIIIFLHTPNILSDEDYLIITTNSAYISFCRPWVIYACRTLSTNGRLKKTLVKIEIYNINKTNWDKDDVDVLMMLDGRLDMLVNKQKLS